MAVKGSCTPRQEVLRGDLDDTIFAADFGSLVSGENVPKVYKDPKTFFRNTHPAKPLCKVVQAIFGRLADPKQGGVAVRLSTGFGGGKTHTLMALWHLASHIDDTSRVVNLFLRQSVDEQVYRVLRERCGLFEHFVGAMQAVLARARNFLLGHERGVPAEVLGAVAEQIRQDPLADETYLESDADAAVGTVPIISRSDLVDALRSVDGVAGVRVKAKPGEGCFVVTGLGKKHMRLSADVRVLESDRAVEPLTTDCTTVLALAERLQRKGERLPLVIGTHRSGAFRAAVAIWIGDGGTEAVADIARLKQLFEAWSGEFVDPTAWLAANEAAHAEAKRLVGEMEARASQTETSGLKAQVAAARSRLLKELGRYLACTGQGTDDLNGVLHRLMERETATRSRLMQAYERLEGYPTWEPDLCRELGDFASALSENQRKARLLGKELDAALQDPRWQARVIE